jgi:hypothetical protein
MRTLGTRRVAWLAGAALIGSLGLTGCSAGQVAETALKRPSSQGVNSQNQSGDILIRNLSVVYNGPGGYQPGADAALEVTLANQSQKPVDVMVSSGAPATGLGQPTEGVITATQVTVSGGSAAPAPSASTDGAGAPAGEPAKITLPALGAVSFLPGDAQKLVASGLNGKLVPGNQLSLIFTFSDGSPAVKVLAPMGIPLSPAPRDSGNPEENVEGGE